MKGACFCGFVTYTVTGEPTLSAYCHCTNCQRMLGCPFVNTIHFPSSAFQWTHPTPHEERMDSFIPPSKPYKIRYRCKNCGACVASVNSKTDNTSVWGAHFARDEDGKILDREAVQPTAHIFYGTRMLDVKDNLGKWEGYENGSTRLE